MDTKPLAKGERIQTTGSYRGSILYSTTHGNIIIEIYGTYYKRTSLSDAKSLIDNLIASRAN
jgi:hypothetical protein